MKFCFIVVLSISLLSTCYSVEDNNKVHFTNSWAVHIENGNDEVASEIAEKHGFSSLGQIGSLPGYFHFVKKKSELVHHRSRRGVNVEDQTVTLLSEEKIKWAEQQHVLERDKRSIVPDYLQVVHSRAYTIQDPLYNDQWYLNNVGQSSGPPGLDINVIPVWARGVSGRDVVVAVLDDGLDHTHPDLRKNYDPKASYDFNDYDEDPMPRTSDPNNCHGTKCAGEVAAEAGNGICGVGVAFNASVGGIRMLDGNTTDTIEGSALSFKKDYIDIYSCAWGPKDDGKRFGRPGTLASKALELGAKEGRNGLGSIFVWATGNGGLTDDDCNCDGYTTSVYTVSIGAISDHGLSTYYTESCASTLAVTYSGGSHREKRENKIITTTLNHKCTDEFKGTSSAAPLAAGMIALNLEANRNLTWRDVQHIIVETSLMTSPLDEGWRRNGAGKWFNQKFGFGRMDASAMIEKADSWTNVAEQRMCWSDKSVGPWSIPSSGTIAVAMNTSSCSETMSEIKTLEHVQVVLSLKHRHRGHLSVELISPSGTRTQLLKTRRNDRSTKGLKDWVFMSVHFWGEDPKGVWTLAVTDNSNNNREHHRKKTKFGDFEDATEAMQDKLEQTSDAEHDAIVEEADQFSETEEFENNVFEDDSFKKRKKEKEVQTQIEEQERKLREENARKERAKQKELEELKRLNKKRKQNEKKKKMKKKKMKPSNIAKGLNEDADELVNEILGEQKLPSEGAPMSPVPAAAPMNAPGAPINVVPTPLVSKPYIQPPPVAEYAHNPVSNASQVSSALHTPPPLTTTTMNALNNSVNTGGSEENRMLENMLKTVLSETFANFRNESENGYKNFEDRLADLESVLKRNTSISVPRMESVQSSLVKAWKSGKAIDKINNVLGVLENHRNQSTTNSSFSKNSEVVSDVLKVLKDILSTSKDDSNIKRYKERISKLMETGSNSTRRLTEKLFTDMQPQEEGKEVSANVITDAMAIVSHIFKKRSQSGPKLKVAKLPAKLPKDVRIVLQGPKGNVVLPYEMIAPLSGSKKEVTTTMSSKELHQDDNSIDTITYQHKKIRHTPKEKTKQFADKDRTEDNEVKDIDGHRMIETDGDEGSSADEDDSEEGHEADKNIEIETSRVSDSLTEPDTPEKEGKSQSNSDESNSFTISVTKNGKLRKVKPKRLFYNKQKSNLYFEKPSESDRSRGKKKSMMDNIDVEVMFDKDDSSPSSSSNSADKPKSVNDYENMDEIKNLERKGGLDVARFGAHDDSGKDNLEDVGSVSWHDSGKKHSSSKSKESYDSSESSPNHRVAKKAKKKKVIPSHHNSHYNLREDEMPDYSIEALPFLQFADPSQLAQIPQAEGDDGGFLQSLYQPYTANKFEANRPDTERASFYRANRRQILNSKRNSITNGTKRHAVKEEPQIHLNSPSVANRRQRRSTHAFDERIIREKRNNIDEEDNDEKDDGPHVVKRSAIFSEIYPSNRFADDDNVVETFEAPHMTPLDSEIDRRSAIKKAYQLEGALKRKLITMRKQSSSVLDIIKRVHDDISVGDSRDLRKLEKQLSQLEQAKYNSLYDAQSPPKQKTPLVRTKVLKKPPRDPKEDPDEYYKYGVTSSGELETWTLLFYGTGP